MDAIYKSEGIAVNSHFASIFNELGLTIEVQGSTSDRDIIILQNMALPYLNEVLPKGNSEFTWVLIFTRAGKAVEQSYPGDCLLNPDNFPELSHYDDEQ